MKKQVRLPSHIKPERYKLLIKPDLEKFTFEGEEKITVMLDRSTSLITLHSKELDISEVEFRIPNSEFRTKSIKYDRKAETATLFFYRKLPKGKGALSLKFKGILNDKMRGFYRSHYFHQGQKKHIATTQFEATDARRAFPCFDEPAQKAIFDITIMVPPGLMAISNTVESSVKEHESGYKVVQFEPTPKMSTYLLAFIVGEFEWIEGRAKTNSKFNPFGKLRASNQKSKILVRVFTTPGKKHQAKFALNCAIKILDFYSKYFDIPYPLPVLDLIAIPDFSHGAMENWGAVTYRESALLVDPEHSSAANKQWVALVIAHELAHQWFGNLVTMRWWTDLWLNEGFASYIEYLAVDRIFPAWDIWTQFAYNDLGVALKLDALKNTHPIEIEVHHPDEIGEIFDEVSYSKGASVIRMLASYLGKKVFQQGLRHYLKRHSYQNAETQDLWKAFEKVSRKPIKKIMTNWTKKSGYPVVRIIDKPKNFKLVQSRFFASPVSKKQVRVKTVWDIPFSTIDDRHRKSTVTLSRPSATLPLWGRGAEGWIKFNAGESSFVRIDYPAQLLAKLRQPIKNKQLPPIDRLGVIRDAFALAESGNLPTTQVLELCQAFTDESDYTVWVEIIMNLNALNNLLYGQKYYESFRKFARGLLAKITKEAGWKAQKNEPHTRSLLRSLILQASGSFGERSIIDRSKRFFNRWMLKNIQPKPDLRSAIYSLSAENFGFKEYWFLIKRYKSESLHEEKNRIGRALGKFKDDRLIAKTLEFALSKEVRHQDTASLFNSAWSNPYAKMRTWEFTKKHWKILLKRYPSSGHMLNRFVKPISLFTTLKQAEEVKSFFQKHKAPGAKRTIDQVLEKIHINHLWLKRDLQKIENWLK